jgi:hypothetical protein
MDEVTVTIAKLQALHKTVSNRLAGRGLYFDPPTVLDYFERYEKFRDKLKALFPDLFSDIPVRAIPKSSGTTDNEGRGYIEKNPIGFLLMDMTEMLEIWEHSQSGKVSVPSMKVTREGVFFSGQYFDALLRVRDILAQAKKSIVIIDGYVNEDVLNLVSGKDKSVGVNILTKNVSVALNTAANAFNKQYGGLSIRTSSVFHDRFVIIDDRDFYHFGASIKDLGNRGFMFSLIEESFVIDALRAQFNQEWAKATVVL